MAICTVMVAAFVAALALPVAAHAATTYHVSVVGSDTAGTGTPAKPFATVQKAVDEATHTGDAVYVGAGIFSGDVTMTVQNAGMSLHGAGASLTTLRGDGKNSVIYADNIGAGSTISGFTIMGRGGSAVYGGGIRCDRSSPTITGNMITGNRAADGGGISCRFGSSPLITNDVISGNTAVTGGGISCSQSSSPTITGDTIAYNTAGSSGGGIYCEHFSQTIAGNTITGNTAGSEGGGIWCDSSSPAITGNTIAGNTATYDGGGIVCEFSSPSLAITGNTVADNGAGTAGGGIYCEVSSPAITCNTVAGNTASTGGGIYCDPSSSPAITNDVIASNSSSNGGGVYLSAVVSLVSNDTVADNSASGAGGGMYCGTGGQPVTNCIFWGNAPLFHGSLTPWNTDGFINYAPMGDISADPQFVDAASGDYHLKSTSPCINEATSTAAPATDRDGVPRPWGAGVDMGAYEYYIALFHTTTSLSGSSSVKANTTLALAGTVSPKATSPYTPPGTVTIAKTHKVGKTWKGAGSAHVGVVGGKYSYSFKPTSKGSWHFTATYSGGVVGPTTYLPSASGVKGVTVK